MSESTSVSTPTSSSTPSPKATTPPPAPRKRKKQEHDIPVRDTKPVSQIVVVTYTRESPEGEDTEIYFLSQAECQQYGFRVVQNAHVASTDDITEFTRETTKAEDIEDFFEGHDGPQRGFIEVVGYACVRIGYDD